MKPTIKATNAQMAHSISKAGIRVIKDTLHRRGSLVTDEIYNQRYAKCKECPSFRADGRCAECGCFMNLKAKFKFASCPKGEWESEV